MANIPISALPNVQPSGYTPNDLLVLVNYSDPPFTGDTKNTSLLDISSYIFSSFTGNTSATCITDLYVTNLYGCSPINVNDSLIMTTGTSISSSNGTAKIELDSGGNPDTLFISTSSGDTYLQLDSNLQFISNYGYLYSYAINSITEESEGQIENLVYGNLSGPNIKWKMDAGTGGNPGLFHISNSGGYNTSGEFIKFGFDSFNNGGYLNIGSKSGSDSVLTIESNKSGLYFDDSAPLSPYSPPRPYALFDSRYTIDIFTDRVSTSTDSDFSLRIVNQDNFKKSGLYAGYLNSLELASNDKTIFFSRDNSSLGYYGFNGASVGGAGGTILIGTGSNSYIESGITNTVVIGGNNIIANTSDTVYVPNLNIGTIGSNPSVINLGLDSNGFVVTGQTGFTGGTVTGETTFTGGLSATTLSATTIDLCVTNGTLYTDSISGCSPINMLSETIFNQGLSATTISATTYENLPVSGVTSTGTGVSLISTIIDGDVKLKSINGNVSGKISADTISDTVELDVVEPNLDLWNLVIPNGNRLLYGDVSYVSGLTFDVGPCKYIIENSYYYAPLTTITLSSGSTDDRIDVIYADTNGIIGVLSGDPSTNPVKPNVDNTTQCEISFVNVSASATSLNPNQFIIFDEDTGPPSEWDFLTGGPQSTKIVIDNTIGYTGTTSVRASGITYNVTPTFFRLSGTSVVDTNNYATIQFAMRNLSANNINTVIRFRFLNSNLTTNGVQIGMDAATTATNPIKYSATNVSGWQLISIPLWRFQLSNTNVSLFEVSFSTPNIVGVQARYYFDYFRFVAGSSSSPPSNSWTVIQGDSTATMSAPSPNATLRISGGTNIGSTLFSSLNPRTIRIDLDNNINLSGITASTVSASTYQNVPNIYTSDGTLNANRTVSLNSYSLNFDEDITINDIKFGRGNTNNPLNDTIAIGNSALINLNSGSADGNIAIGTSAMTDSVAGAYNTAVGHYSLKKSTNKWNTALGYESLTNLESGQNNTSIGFKSGFNMTSADANTNIGAYSMFYTTVGGQNISVGYQSLQSNTEGSRNTALGYNSLANNTTGNTNTAIGHGTLTSNITGDDNTAVGYSANVSSGGLTNATAIGANTIVSASNSLVLGNNANVGIGVSAPSEKLEVSGKTKTDKLRISNPYVPSGSTDPTGNSGDISWSGNSFYWRDSSQWYVVTGATF